MAASRSLFWCLIGLNLVAFTSCSFFYPNAQASLLEHLLVDTHGNHASGFANAITPCSNYVSGSQNFGRTTAAQWLRVSFHDFITANVTAGTGGIDVSTVLISTRCVVISNEFENLLMCQRVLHIETSIKCHSYECVKLCYTSTHHMTFVFPKSSTWIETLLAHILHL